MINLTARIDWAISDIDQTTTFGRGFPSRKFPIITKAPSELNKYLGMLDKVPVDAGTRITRIENIQSEEGIFLTPRMITVMKNIVRAKSK